MELRFLGFEPGSGHPTPGFFVCLKSDEREKGESGVKVVQTLNITGENISIYCYGGSQAVPVRSSARGRLSTKAFESGKSRAMKCKAKREAKKSLIASDRNFELLR
jgi:hypothetical protein